MLVIKSRVSSWLVMTIGLLVIKIKRVSSWMTVGLLENFGASQLARLSGHKFGGVDLTTNAPRPSELIVEIFFVGSAEISQLSAGDVTKGLVPIFVKS